MGSSGYTGQNPAPGPIISYLVNTIPAGATPKLEVLDGTGTVVRQLTMNRSPGLHRVAWDMRAGSPLTGPVQAPPAGRGGGAAGGGGGGGGGGRGGAGGEITFVVMPGTYRARLTITPGSGPATVMEQPFTLLRDGAVILTDAELRQLNTTRLTIARLQAGLRETQARIDSVQRQLGDARRTADSVAATSASAKDDLTALEAEVASIVSVIGGAPGRGGGAGGGAGRGGRAGGGGAGTGRGNDDDEQQGPPPTPPTQTITARLGSLNELMAGQFNPNPDQRRAAAELPALLRQQDEKLQRIMRDRLPTVLQALKSR
jgi:hypothetical protein